MVDGLVEKLSATFSGQSTLAVEGAVASGLAKALGNEDIDAHEVSCMRDYSGLCPAGMPTT